MLTILSPAFALVVAVALLVQHTLAPRSADWRLTALAAAAFAAFTALTIAREGLWTVVALITDSLWTNQLFIDLVLALSVAWMVALPRARAQNMALWGWLLAILCSGSIGLLAALARLQYLEANAAPSAAASRA